MATGKYKTVSDLLKDVPSLKMKEFSKQYVRDALLEMGFDPAKHTSAPQLTDDQVVECSYRYLNIYQRITGVTFTFPEMKLDPSKRILLNLQQRGVIAGATA